MGWACGAYYVRRGVYRVLLGKPEGRRPLGRPRRRWVDNIRIDLQEVGCGYMDWIGLAQDRDRWRTLVNAAMNLRVPWNAGNFLTSFKPVSFSRRTLHPGVSKYGVTLYVFRTVFSSIISSSRLYIQQTNRYCCLLASKQTAVSVWQMHVALCTVLNSWWWTERPSETCRVLPNIK